MKFIFFGIVQGLTEFLPVSSSGHLYILKNFLNLNQGLLGFFIFLHLATLLVIGVFLHKEIISSLFKKNILIYLAVVTAITAAFGLAIDHFLKDFFENKFFIPFCLFLNGAVILGVKNTSENRGINSISLRDALVMGLLQGLAVFPGISRSGITIVGLLKRGVKAKDAFSLSFLMAIPAIIGAFLLKSKELLRSGLVLAEAAAGFIAAFVFGLAALVILRKTLINKKFKYFGYYCIALSLLALFA